MISRREFVRDMAVAGTASALGLSSGARAAEPPPETTRIRLSKTPSACVAPQYVAEALLRAEGFTHIEYVGPPRACLARSGQVPAKSMSR